MKTLRARSPAKLILSGEHAVLYGCPALAMAVDRYAESAISMHRFPYIFFNFLNLDYAKSFTIQAVTVLKHRLQEQYDAFLAGQCQIREVLKMPFELLQFTVGNLLEKWNIHLPQGFEFHSSSNIPMGCGMGSSAVAVMSTCVVMANFFKQEADNHWFLNLGKEAENLQHGKSSGLDLQLALQGGCVKFKQGQIEKRNMPDFPFTIVQTGRPETTTGQCVTMVAKHFKESSIIEDFSAVTDSLDEALKEKNWQNIHQAVRANHHLLIKIGVVPDKVAAFIHAIEKRGGSAKICGAGAVSGERAGVLWMNCEENIDDLLKIYGYECQHVQGDVHGTRLL